MEHLDQKRTPRMTQPHASDGARLIQRETSRDATLVGLFSQPRVTRFVPAFPGGGGPMAYIDSDGTIDFDMTDHFGRPWFLFRGREGSSGIRRSALEFSTCRGTGVLARPSFPVSPHMGG